MTLENSHTRIVCGISLTLLLILSGCWPNPFPPQRPTLTLPGVTQITDAQDRLASRDPVWSPDGKQIAMMDVQGHRTDALVEEIYLVDVATGALRQVTDDEPEGVNRAPSWSPDGKRLGLTSDEFGQTGVGYIDLESGETVWVAASGELEWLPDGQRVAFLAGSEEGTQIEMGVGVAVRDLDTGHTSVIWEGSARYIQFDSMEWARDADLLAISYEGQNQLEGSWHPINYDIHVIDIEGHHRVAVATEEAETSPTWSPDARLLAYGKGSYNESTLWVSNADGSCAVQLLDVEGVTDPAWSPDGKRIAFMYSLDLYILDLTVEPFAERMKELDCQ